MDWHCEKSITQVYTPILEWKGSSSLSVSLSLPLTINLARSSTLSSEVPICALKSLNHNVHVSHRLSADCGHGAQKRSSVLWYPTGPHTSPPLSIKNPDCSPLFSGEVEGDWRKGRRKGGSRGRGRLCCLLGRLTSIILQVSSSWLMTPWTLSLLLTIIAILSVSSDWGSVCVGVCGCGHTYRRHACIHTHTHIHTHTDTHKYTPTRTQTHTLKWEHTLTNPLERQLSSEITWKITLMMANETSVSLLLWYLSNLSEWHPDSKTEAVWSFINYAEMYLRRTFWFWKTLLRGATSQSLWSPNTLHMEQVGVLHVTQ